MRTGSIRGLWAAVFLVMVLLLTVMAGPASGAASLFAPAQDYQTGTGPESVTEGDFNGDRYADLAVATYRSNTVSVLQ